MLRVDPAFDRFVGDLGEYYDRLKKTLPAEDAGATPFVRGRGGTAEELSDVGGGGAALWLVLANKGAGVWRRGHPKEAAKRGAKRGPPAAGAHPVAWLSCGHVIGT